MKQIKINYVIKGELKKEITISENFITRAYAIYRAEKIKDNELLTSIIKVMLSEENGLKELKEGIEFNGEKYVPLITSPGMQKKEEEFDGEDYKLEYFFILAKEEKFKDILERLLSGNKIAKFKEDKKEMCLVKDISARLGLATTGTEKINYKPYTVIVDEAKYEYIGKYSFYKNNKIDNDELTRKYILNDGGGLMSDDCARAIKEHLELKHRVDFAIIRMYKGLAVKGVAVRFNFADYFKENYKGNYGVKEGKFGFRKNGEVYEIKDIFGEWHNVDDIDLLLNKSQVKWSKNWESLDDLNEEYKDEFYRPYLNILNHLYVSKVNKNPNELKTHTKINYQVIQNTCLTDEDLIEIAKPDITYYKRLLDFKDLDAVRLFLGDIAREDNNEFTATISDRLNYMLKKQGEEALKDRWVRRQIARMITKKISQLSGGKINLEGGYKICALDPISYCNFLLTGNTGNNGLNEHEFYIAGNIGKRVMYRNPIACYWEIQKIELTNNLDKWLKDYTPELIFFNAKDDTLFKLSTADLDGDGVGVINNHTLYDCVVDEEYPFINIKDGEDGEEHIFNDDNLYEDIIASSGNMIGKIAINNSKLNMICRSIDNTVKDNNYPYTWRMLEKLYCENKKIDFNLLEDNKDLKKEVKEKIKLEKKEWEKAGKAKNVSNFNNSGKRKIIEVLFKAHKTEYSNILLASQLAIDMPKTLKPVPEEILDKFKWLDFVGKPAFMHYLEKCGCKGKYSVWKCESIVHKQSWTRFKKEHTEDEKWKNIKRVSNMMDIFNKYVEDELLEKAKKTQNGSESITHLLNKLNYNIKEDIAISAEFKSILDKYKKVRKEYFEDIKEKCDDSEVLDLLDLETYRELDKLNLTDDEIVTNIKTFKKKITTRFVLIFFWNTYKRKVEEQGICDAYSYEEDKDGNIDWMYKKYKIENVNFIENDIQADSYKNTLKKTNNLVKVRIGGLIETEIKNKEIEIKKGDFTDKKGEKREQLQVLIDDAMMVGYIFNDCAELINIDNKYLINDIEPDKSGRTATVFLEII